MTFQVTFQLSVLIALNFGEILTGLERKCHLRTMYCPCDEVYNKTDGGFKVGVTYRDCGKRVLCSYKDVFKKCQRVYSMLQRQKRDSPSNAKHVNCFNNGTLQTPNSDVGPPSVTINGEAKDVRVDEDPSFKCDVQANPAATISWQFNGGELNGKHVEHSLDACGQTLSLKDVSVKDSGTYTCVVENVLGKATASANLSVVPQPGPYIDYVDLEGKEDTAYTKSNINITCKSYNSVSNIFFKPPETPILEQTGVHKYTYYHSIKGAALITALEIRNVTMEDAGNYTCYAVRSTLQSNKTYILKVGPCPGGSYCLRHGNKALLCEPGTYRRGSSNVTDKCTMCSAGHFCPPGSEEPQPCRWGTYMPFNNASAFQDCIICPGVVLSDEGNNAEPAVNRTNCPPVKSQKFQDPEGGFTSSPSPLSISEMVGAVAGAAVAVVVIAGVSLYCVAKKGRMPCSWLSKLTTNHRDLESHAGHTISSHDAQLFQPLKSNTDDTANSAVLKAAVEQEYEIRHDVFICYSSKDTSWVKELLEELERRNFSCCIDFRNFVPGAAIVRNIAEAIYHSRKTIAVLSPDFVNSDWCGHELQKALTRIRFHQVVPVVYKHCEIPLVLQDRTYLDWENCHVKPYFWQQLERALNQSNDGLL